MEILYLLIPMGLLLIALALRFLFWAIKSGQYDDLDTEAQRILFAEKGVVEKNSNKPSKPRTSVLDKEDNNG